MVDRDGVEPPEHNTTHLQCAPLPLTVYLSICNNKPYNERDSNPISLRRVSINRYATLVLIGVGKFPNKGGPVYRPDYSQLLVKLPDGLLTIRLSRICGLPPIALGRLFLHRTIFCVAAQSASLVENMGFEPICFPLCKRGNHPKQFHSP